MENGLERFNSTADSPDSIASSTGIKCGFYFESRYRMVACVRACTELLSRVRVGGRTKTREVIANRRPRQILLSLARLQMIPRTSNARQRLDTSDEISVRSSFLGTYLPLPMSSSRCSLGEWTKFHLAIFQKYLTLYRMSLYTCDRLNVSTSRT